MEQIISFDPVKNPLVSVICLCYNQARFVKEALDSVVNQTYSMIELIVVDDGSNDDSKAVIKEWREDHEEVPFVNLKDNVGNTTAFNQGLKLASGKYVIDLAADDVLLKNRVERQVEFFESLHSAVGVIYSDALYIDENGKVLHQHFASPRFKPYEGEIYEKLIDTYFIPPPTMMVKKEVFDELKGYDGSLAYEDFDFWVRSSRNWRYGYQRESLIHIRKWSNSHSTGWYKKNDKQLHSTFKVCEKIRRLNQTNGECEALIRRIRFELRQSFFSGNHAEFKLFYELLEDLSKVPTKYVLMNQLNRLHLDLSWMRNLYHKLRFS
ncbi:glycosyltransferase [Reichenbachiella sp.]